MIKLAYFGDGKDLDLDDVTIGGLTNINWSFLRVQDKEGNLGHTWVNQHKIAEVKAKYPHLKVSLAIGGWGAGNFSEAVEKEETRSTFVKDAINYVLEYDADGIDLDWEYPGVPGGGISSHPNDRQNFVLLMKDLRSALDQLSKTTKREYLLTMAVGSSVGSQIGVDFPALDQYLDFINVMTYDMGGTFSTTGHQTSLYPSAITNQLGGAEVIDRIISYGISPQKLVYGCAFYGRGGTGVIAMDENQTGICSRYYGEQGLFFDYDDILEKIEKEGYTEYYDEEAVAVYAFNGDTFITYDNPKTIAKKMEYVVEKKLGGIMYWEHQTDKSRSLAKEIIKN